MAAPFDLNDENVVVIIGTGAGGGVLGHELALKGIPVVALEAGGDYQPEDFINDEWESFAQLAWLDMRTTSGTWRIAKDFPNLPSWIVKAVGGTTTHFAGASIRFQEHEWKALSTYGPVQGANLLDWPIDGAEMAPWYDKAEAKMGVTRTGGRPGLPGNNNYKVFEAGREEARLPERRHRDDGDQRGRLRRPGRAAGRPASASRAASGARSGRPPIPTCRGRWTPATTSSGPGPWRCGSSMTTAAG